MLNERISFNQKIYIIFQMFNIIMEKESKSINKEILMVLSITAMMIIAAVALYYYWPEDSNGDDSPSIDRSVKFPKDEGLHHDYFEIWEFFSNLETRSGDEIKLLSRCANYTNSEDAHIGYEFIDMNNVTGEGDHVIFTEEGAMEGTVGDMDMEYTGGGSYTKIVREGNKQYSVETGYGSVMLALNLNLKKSPILIGDEGKLYKTDFGTLFGYYQPNFEISGELYKDDELVSEVKGKGWLEHVWGGDLRPLSKEEWQIQLDNSVEIFFSKGYEPQGTYPDDLFLHSLNIIRNDGKLLTPRLGQDIFISYEKFKIIPSDDLNKRAWSYRWNIYGENINITVYPHPEKSIHQWTYLGFCHATGTYNGISVTGTGTCELSKRYISEPDIVKVENYYNNLEPTEPVDIYANLSYYPPIDLTDIEIEYSINDAAWKEIDMVYEEGFWKGTIPGQTPGTKVEYRISVTDLAEKTVKSEIDVYYVDYT